MTSCAENKEESGVWLRNETAGPCEHPQHFPRVADLCGIPLTHRRWMCPGCGQIVQVRGELVITHVAFSSKERVKGDPSGTTWREEVHHLGVPGK